MRPRALSWLGRLRWPGGEEARMVTLLGLGLFTAIAAQTTTKVVRDAVFMSRFGLAELAWAMMAMAIVAWVALRGYERLTARHGRNRVIWALHGLIALTLVFFGSGLRAGLPYLPVALYLWAGVFSVAVIAEFWLLTADLLHAREAKRLFALIAAGGILGGIFGGGTARWLAPRIGSSQLLWVAAAELLAGAAFCQLAWSTRLGPSIPVEPSGSGRGSLRDGLALIAARPYLRMLALATVCMTIATTVIDWQLKGYAKAHFGSDQDRMAAFFGVLAVVLGILSFLMQVLGTERLLRTFGVGRCLRSLPTVTGLGSLLILLSMVVPIGALAAAAIGATLVDALRFSIDRSATEMLYLPLPSRERATAMRFIETVVDRIAGAVLALVWLGLIAVAHVDHPERLAWVSVGTLVLIGVWVFCLERLSKLYLDAYRVVIGSVPAEVPMASATPRQKARALRLLERLGDDPVARTRILRAVTSIQRGTPAFGLDHEEVDRHLVDEIVYAGALQRIYHSMPGWGAPQARWLQRMIAERLVRCIERISRLLALIYPPRDIAAAHRALRGGSPHVRAGALELLDAMIDSERKAQLIEVLERHALGVAIDEPLTRRDGLRLLFSAPDAPLRACAAWTAVGSGMLTDEVRALAARDPSRRVRTLARLALIRLRGRRPASPIPPPPAITEGA